MPERLIHNPSSECPSKLGAWLGHRFVPVVNAQNDAREAIICNRCGLVIGPALIDGCQRGGTLKFVITVQCDNPLVDMAVENAADTLRREVEPYAGIVTVSQFDGSETP
jgi:hypothetical protein